MLGYWREPPPAHYLGYPDPAALIDPAWEPERRDRIRHYLQSGKPLAQYAGFSSCRFADCKHPERDRLGTKDLTDGRWIWPEGLWHYVQDHAVRLPDELVATAAARDFTIPSDLSDQVVDADPAFWLRWAAEHTPAPAAAPDACSLDEARAIATELSTQRWTATVTPELGRWKLELTTGLNPEPSAERTTRADYSGPISAYALRDYLFPRRIPDNDKLLEPDRAIAIAKDYASGKRRIQPFAGKTADDGRTWWAIISSGPSPDKRFEDIDLRAIPLPEPGWTTFLPGDWKVDVLPAMDEPAWRFFVERWQRGLASASLDEPPATPPPATPPPATSPPATPPPASPSGWRRLLRAIVGR
jgi:hypothetical protein